jgi:hypothetical protein
MHMNIFRARKTQSQIVRLNRSQPLAAHLSRGSAVYAIDGLLWVTQEGLIDDVVLKPGQRFDVRHPGLIVATAVEEPSRMYIAADDSPARDMITMSTESVEVLHRRARDLRRQELARWARLIQGYFIHLARRIKALRRGNKWSPAL